jgi:hypothetical protein
MSADISALGGLREIEPLDLENYQDQKDFIPIPKKGRYTVQAPPSFPSTAYGRSQAGALTAQVDPTITAGPHEGYKIRFVKPSAKTYKRNGATVSQMGDYFRAFGIRRKFTTEVEIADAVEETANRTYQVDLDWKVWNKNTQSGIEGMENFPSDGNGGHLPYWDDPQDFVKDESTGEFILDDNGNKVNVRLRANVYVTKFVPLT